MKNFIAHALIQDGKLRWINEAYMAHWLPKFEGQKAVLTIKKKWSKRSLNQNKLYWLWLDIIAEDTGHTPDELHTIYKGLFSPKKIIKVGKRVFNIPKGTSELSKGEMVEYMLNVEAEAGSLGIILPSPNDI